MSAVVKKNDLLRPVARMDTSGASANECTKSLCGIMAVERSSAYSTGLWSTYSYVSPWSPTSANGTFVGRLAMISVLCVSSVCSGWPPYALSVHASACSTALSDMRMPREISREITAPSQFACMITPPCTMLGINRDAVAGAGAVCGAVACGGGWAGSSGDGGNTRTRRGFSSSGTSTSVRACARVRRGNTMRRSLYSSRTTAL